MARLSAKAVEPARSLASLLTDCEAARAGGDNALGERLAREAFALAQQVADGAGAARAASLLAIHLFRQGCSVETVEHGRAVLSQVDTAGAPAWGIELRHTLTMACNEIGLPNEALSHAVDALHRARTLGCTRLLSWSLGRLGTTFETLGDFERALDYLGQAVEAAGKSGDVEARFAAHVNLAVALMQRVRMAGPDGDVVGKMEDARNALAAAKQATDLCGTHPHQRMYCCGIECSALLAAGQLDETRAAVNRYQALARDHGVACFVQLGHLYEADWLVGSGHAAEACALLGRRVDESALKDHPNWMRWLLDVRHRASKAAGQATQALAAVEALLALERREARQRLDLQTRQLVRDLEVQSARDEARRLLHRARELEASAAAAFVDPLTGLANRRALDEHLSGLLPRQGERRRDFSVAMIDIDHFKAINDRHGHAAGDSVLRDFSQLLHGATRAGDMAARYGGEEFVLVLSAGAIPAAEACERARKLVERHPWSSLPPGWVVTVSIGLVTIRSDESAASLLSRADAALYAAKRGGRNRLVVDGSA